MRDRESEKERVRERERESERERYIIERRIDTGIFAKTEIHM